MQDLVGGTTVHRRLGKRLSSKVLPLKSIPRSVARSLLKDYRKMAGGQLKSLIGSIRRKPATAPDRRTDDQAASAPKLEKTSLVHDIVHGSAKNNAFLAGALPKLASGEPLDDKELLLEHGVSMLQAMPPNSGLSSTVSDGFIKMLYNDLPHPSTTVSCGTTNFERYCRLGNSQ